MATTSTDGQAKASPTAAKPDSIQFDYIKSNFFRVIHADGAIGGVTPSGMIHLALYNERPAIPKAVTHARGGGTGLGEVITSESRPGFVRELEVDAFITISMAESLIIWLRDRIEEARLREAELLERSASKTPPIEG